MCNGTPCIIEKILPLSYRISYTYRVYIGRQFTLHDYIFAILYISKMIQLTLNFYIRESEPCAMTSFRLKLIRCISLTHFGKGVVGRCDGAG